MEIIRAKNSGFCFGVKQAIDMTEKLSKEHDRKGRIYTVGPLIHNIQVTDDLKGKGVEIIESPMEAEEGDTVIVRSHGQTREFYDACKTANLEVVDATCPFVSKIHKLVWEASKAGKNIFIVGDKNHPEVVGISGWCQGKVFIAKSGEDAKEYSETSCFLVCQTTIKEEVLEDVLDILREKDVKVEVNNTICSATKMRQKSTEDLAKTVHAMVIIGGKNSSNTQKLYEIAKHHCQKTFFVENIDDLPLKDVAKCNKIGIAAGASTPECIIKEVIANMSDNITNDAMSMADFMEEIDASLRLPRNGEIVTGKVHEVNEKEVIVNMGCKKDGILSEEEVTLEEGKKLTDLFKEGDEIQAKVIKIEDGDGSIMLSKKKLEINEHWNEINDALENKSTISVKVLRTVNGGVIASYKEVSGFIPLSQLALKYVEHAEEYVGKTLDVKVTKVDQRRNRAVFSHKAVLIEEKKKLLAEIWSKLNVDDIVEGTVMRFTDYGAFVDIGGIDGLLHISEISWGKLRHPQEVLEIGDKIKVKILSMNEEKGKISLGLKQTMPEPWSIIDEKYQVGETVKGTVVQIKEYGAFVELEPGLDGLVHISEVAPKRVENIGDVLSVGQEIEAKVLAIDVDRHRISLSLKDMELHTEAAEEAEEVVEEVS